MGTILEPEQLALPELISDNDLVSTPFEAWCDANRVHPEHPHAWDSFVRATETPGA